MTAFTTFAEPAATWSITPTKFAGTALFERDRVIMALGPKDFALLLRAVELVVVAQAFSRRGIEHALRLEPNIADRLTTLLEGLGVISAGGFEEQRRVLIAMDHLAVLLVRLYGCRESAPAAAAA
jgi:DNA segregation ATPase FtsK/SpoIIIE-like protein